MPRRSHDSDLAALRARYSDAEKGTANSIHNRQPVGRYDDTERPAPFSQLWPGPKEIRPGKT